MENIKQFIIDYLEGRIESKQFLRELREKPEIMEWLQSIVPKGETMCIDEGVDFDGNSKIKSVSYNIQYSIRDIWTCSGSSLVGRELNTFSEIARLMRTAFPNLILYEDTTLKDKFNFLLDACPDYLNSVGIAEAGILDDLMVSLPKSMSKTKRIKEFRKRLKEMFYVEGQKYPRWIQESEWPLSKTGKPTKFLRQKNKGEISYYYFLDVDTNEEIEVMQAY